MCPCTEPRINYPLLLIHADRRLSSNAVFVAQKFLERALNDRPDQMRVVQPMVIGSWVLAGLALLFYVFTNFVVDASCELSSQSIFVFILMAAVAMIVTTMPCFLC
jgi:sterol desaturase/sphingolipid hydroxylase (fatty acid hydroxylase superfamily)